MPDKPSASSTGYDAEDDYFKRKDLELLAQRRAALDAERAKQAQAGPSHPHWMKCPKCGGEMKEIAMESVKVDQCGSCGGIYFDKGELELLTHARQPAGLFKKLFG